MSKESTLVKNTIIYAIGNFGSKVLAYIMVLVYSYYILPDDMGYYDLILTTVEMIRPLVLFQINDGVYRFMLDSKKEEKPLIIGTGLRFLCLTTIAAELIFIIAAVIFKLEYPVWIGAYFATTLLFAYMQDSVRGLGDSKLYAASGVTNSFVMLLCEIVGLIILHLGIEALLISKTIANFVCIFVILFKHGEFVSGRHQKADKMLMRALLRYSAPLVPNTICWWIVNSSDRYIILFFLGKAYNGIFSMAYKFPTLLTTVTSIFYLAWQETAIKEYNTSNRDKFFSDVFQKYYRILLSLSLCLIPATHIVIDLFVSAEYKSAWMYTGFLYLGAAFSALCSFLGLGYQISKETQRSLATTIFAAVINIGVHIATIKYIGLQAAALSTFVAYFFLFVIRIKHTKRYFELNVSWREFGLLLGLCVFYLILTLIAKNIPLSFILTAVAMIFTLRLNWNILSPVIKKCHKALLHM